MTKEFSNNIVNTPISWESPANIALVKYWGKKHFQLPKNPSLSITLNECRTITEIIPKSKNTQNEKIKFLFDGESNQAFAQKIEKHLLKISELYPQLNDYHYQINSKNTFPHSSGIASSASSMSALNLCFTDLLLRLNLVTKDEFETVASKLSRMGSGSAARSVYGDIVEWGLESEEFATPIKKVHEYFMGMRDAILIVSSKEKSVSSTLGHSLMNDHPYAEQRFKNAQTNISELLKIMETGDVDSFIDLVEREALELHAMMMCSRPSFILMEPESLTIIEKIRQFRKKSGVKLCFTLDAGPNIHLLYHENDKETVCNFINTDLKEHLENGLWFDDKMGKGPKKIR